MQPSGRVLFWRMCMHEVALGSIPSAWGAEIKEEEKKKRKEKKNKNKKNPKPGIMASE